MRFRQRVILCEVTKVTRNIFQTKCLLLSMETNQYRDVPDVGWAVRDSLHCISQLLLLSVKGVGGGIKRYMDGQNCNQGLFLWIRILSDSLISNELDLKTILKLSERISWPLDKAWSRMLLWGGFRSGLPVLLDRPLCSATLVFRWRDVSPIYLASHCPQEYSYTRSLGTLSLQLTH